MKLESSQVLRSFLAPLDNVYYEEPAANRIQESKSLETITVNSARRVFIEVVVDRNPSLSLKEKTITILKTLSNNAVLILEATACTVAMIGIVVIYALGLYFICMQLPAHLTAANPLDIVANLTLLWTFLCFLGFMLALCEFLDSSFYLHRNLQQELHTVRITVQQNNYIQNIDHCDLLNETSAHGALLDPLTHEQIAMDQINTCRCIKIGDYLFSTSSLMKNLFLNDLSSDQIKHPVEDRYFKYEEQQELFCQLRAMTGATKQSIIDCFNTFGISAYYNSHTKSTMERDKYIAYLRSRRPEYSALTPRQQADYIEVNKQRDFCTLRLQNFLGSLKSEIKTHFKRIIDPA